MNLPRAFTLIELLAVVTILGVAFVIAAGTLVGVDASARLERTTADWRSLDQQARLWARTSRANVYSPVQLAISDDGLTLVDPALDRTATKGTGDVIISLDVADSTSPIVVYDHRGTGPDYQCHFESSNGGERTYAVAGLTGWLKRIDLGAVQ